MTDPIRRRRRPSSRSTCRPSLACCRQRTTVAAELAALARAAGWRPAPGEWSANECVGHLIEAERRGFAGRIRRDPRRGGRTVRISRPISRPGTRRPSPRRAATTCATAAELADEFAGAARESVALVRGADRAEISARSGCIPTSARCASTSSWASGSTTTGTTSARCWP